MWPDTDAAPRVTLFPLQMVVLLPVVAVGGVPAVMVVLLELVHPAALETVTE